MGRTGSPSRSGTSHSSHSSSRSHSSHSSSSRGGSSSGHTSFGHDGSDSTIDLIGLIMLARFAFKSHKDDGYNKFQWVILWITRIVLILMGTAIAVLIASIFTGSI